MRSTVEGPQRIGDIAGSAPLLRPERARGGSFALILLLLATGGCDREAREPRGAPLPETVALPETTTLYAGATTPTREDPRGAMYEGNAYHVSEGARLYKQMNCVGCHSNGGGGMGPPLMDDQWRYGGRMDQIVATLVQGRPNGMPSWRGKLAPTQMWQIAAYVRTLAANVPKDVAPSRSDGLSNLYPRTLADPEGEKPSDTATRQGAVQ